MTRQALRAAAAATGILLGAAVLAGSAASLSLTSQNFTPYRTCTITATPATTTAVADTTARQGSATANFGALTSLTVSSGSGINQRIYIRFDLTTCSPAIPASATVRLATLRLYMTAVPAACRVYDLFPVTTSWVETSLTWNNQPFGTTINNPPTGSRTGTFSVGTPVGCQNQATGGYVTGGTVTTDVATFVAGSATNFGWMIRDDTEGSGTTRTATFSAKELGTVAQEPQLVITYVTVP
ncbi:MAG: DNRLRE domain-containing protein [Chloroflexota bacterium]|nr:DNRLRE domain-containing protein [Chloroflexota bacterium]